MFRKLRQCISLGVSDCYYISKNNNKMTDTLSLVAGYASVAFHIAQFLSQNTRHMLIFGLVSTGLLGLHFCLGGTVLGVYAVVLSVIVKIAALLDYPRVSKAVLVATPITGFAYFFLLAGASETFLPALAMIFIAIADFQKDLIKMKLWYYGSAFSWLCYGLYIESVPAIAYDVLGIIFLTTGIYLAYKKRHSENPAYQPE